MAPDVAGRGRSDNIIRRTVAPSSILKLGRTSKTELSIALAVLILVPPVKWKVVEESERSYGGDRAGEECLAGLWMVCPFLVEMTWQDRAGLRIQAMAEEYPDADTVWIHAYLTKVWILFLSAVMKIRRIYLLCWSENGQPPLCHRDR